MAINPELITTIRVDQLPDETLSLTNLFPHTVGTDLKSATIQELVDLVATAIGVSGGVGYVAISVTDGQQLPDVPELPSFFLCGAGTYLNINGYPDVICTDELNAVMSLTDHWQLAVGIPIVAEVGVQTVTGSAVDNTDPLNPIINEIIDGVQTIVAGTNITVDNTDPSNPIVNATGGGGSQTLAEVLVEGNITDGTDISISDGDKILLDNGANLKKGTTDAGLGGSKGIALRCAVDYELKWEAGRLYVMGGDGYTIREVSHNFTTIPTATDDEDKGFVVDSRWILDNGNVYVCTDATTGAAVWGLQDLGTIPTLQQVTDEGSDAYGNTINLKYSSISDSTIQFNVDDFYEPFIKVENLGAGSAGYSTKLGSSTIEFEGNGDYNTIIQAGSGLDNIVTLPDATGTLALTSDIPTGSGIPHATAAGTDTYTATITGVAAYNDADAFLIRFTNGNTTGATLNINSLGAKTLYRNNDGALIGGDIINGGEMLCIYNTSLNGFQLIGTAPNSLFAYVTNDDSVTLTKGMPVYAFSGTGDRMTVKRAYNTTDATSAQTVGLVLSTSIAAGQKGLIMMQGLLDGLSILPTSTFADGDPVYLGATAGTITNVKPYAPNHLVYLGVVTTASNGSAGRMYVRIQNGYELSEIHDVDLISNAPTNNQGLVYETSTSLWKNKTIDKTFVGLGNVDNTSDANKPVSTATQTALNLRQRKLFNLTPQVTLTGTVTKTIIATYFIPANTFTAGDFLNFSAIVAKTSGNATTHNLEINTTNTLTGATIISTVGFGSTNATMKFKREIVLNGGSAFVLNVSTGTPNDNVVGVNATVLSQFTYNLAADLYFFVTCTLTLTSDNIIYRGIQITD